MSKHKNIKLVKGDGDLGKNQQGTEKKPADLSKLSDGAYPLDIVAAVFIKRGNVGQVILGLKFRQEELSNTIFNVPIGRMEFGSIIVPGIKPPPMGPGKGKG